MHCVVKRKIAAALWLDVGNDPAAGLLVQRLIIIGWIGLLQLITVAVVVANEHRVQRQQLGAEVATRVSRHPQLTSSGP